MRWFRGPIGQPVARLLPGHLWPAAADDVRVIAVLDGHARVGVQLPGFGLNRANMLPLGSVR